MNDVHFTENTDDPVCGAARRDGMRFVQNLLGVTCKGCLDVLQVAEVHPREMAFEEARTPLLVVFGGWLEQQAHLSSAERMVLYTELPMRFAKMMLAVERRGTS